MSSFLHAIAVTTVFSFGMHAACAEPATPTSAPGAAPDPIAQAIAHPDRFAGDRDEDAHRRPAAVLRFLGVKPGMHVVDYFAAGGYYTELLARVVGPEGKVIAYNNEPYAKYAKDVPTKRYGGSRLKNVVQINAPPETAPFKANSLDAALFVQSLHDLYWQAKDGSWPATDVQRSLAALVRGLKSGAKVVVLDHVGAAGSDPARSVDALHRIDPAIVRRDLEKAGLVFEAESTAFANPKDDHDKGVFDEAVRHKTDQFMYRFRKP